MSIQGSDESVISCPSSFSDQDFKAFGGPSFISSHASKDSDDCVKLLRSASFDRVRTTQEHEAFPGKIPTDAARRTLASAIVERSGKMQDEKGRNRLVDLVGLNIQRTEEQLENALDRVDSKSQIAELESLTVSLKDNQAKFASVNTRKTFPWCTPQEAEVKYRFPRRKTKPIFDDRTVQQDHDILFTDFDTTQCSYRRGNDANYSDSEYQDAIRAMRGQRITHSGMSGPDSHITYTDEQRQSRGLGPSPYHRGNPAITSSGRQIRKSLPRHIGYPDNVSIMKPKSERDQSYYQHSLHLVGESHLTNHVTTRALGNRSVQSSSSQVFRSNNVDTGLQSAQSQRHLNPFTGHRHKSGYGNTPNPTQKHYENKYGF